MGKPNVPSPDEKQFEEEFARARPLGISDESWAHLCAEVNGAYVRLRNVAGDRAAEHALQGEPERTVAGVQGEGMDHSERSNGSRTNVRKD